MEYIPINTIDDIDVNQITIRDINKRYIDRNGLRYATRFNLKTRKIEVVRIVKGIQEADMVRRTIQQQKVEPAPRPARTQAPEPEDMDNDIGDDPSVTAMNYSGTNIDSSAFFDEKQFMEECAADFEKFKERFNGIMNSIKNSRYFEANHSDTLSGILRDIDIECIQRCDNAGNYYKELMTYPRPVTYYVSRLSSEQKESVDALETEEEKLDRVRRLEIYATFHETFNVISGVADRLNEMLADVPDDKLRTLPAGQQQALADARVASGYLQENAGQQLARMETWKHKYNL